MRTSQILKVCGMCAVALSLVVGSADPLRAQEAAKPTMQAERTSLTPRAGNFISGKIKFGRSDGALTEERLLSRDYGLDYFSRRQARAWWRYPIIGAGVGAVLVTVWMAQDTGECMDPIGCFLGPPLVGAVLGGAAGGLVELITRAVEH